MNEVGECSLEFPFEQNGKECHNKPINSEDESMDLPERGGLEELDGLIPETVDDCGIGVENLGEVGDELLSHANNNKSHV